MSIPALSSAFGLAKQTAQGSYVDPTTQADKFVWLRSNTITGGAMPRSITLPQEIGGSLLPGGLVRLGISGAFGGDMIPRPNSMGMMLLGVMGKVSSTPTGNMTNVCNGTDSNPSNLATAGKLTGTSYTATGTVNVAGGDTKLLLTYTHASGISQTDVVITGKDAGNNTINETVSFPANANGGTDKRVTNNRFSQVTSVQFPAGVLNDTIKIGTWAGYLHTFTMNDDPADVPYFTVARRVAGSSDGFWELVYDTRMESLALTQEALAVLTATWSMNGIYPIQYNNTSGVSALNTAVDPDASLPFVAPGGGFKLDSDWKTDYYNPAQNRRITVRNMTLQLGVVQDIAREFLVGSYYPADVDVIGRICGISATLLLRDKLLYDKLMYDHTTDASGDVTWKPFLYEVLGNGFEVLFRSGGYIPAAHDGTSKVSYYMTLTGSAVEWTINSIALRSNDLVNATVTGVVVEPDSGEPITVKLLNEVASY